MVDEPPVPDLKEPPRAARVNVTAARTARTRGWSYSKIARSQGVTESAVYYALNRHKRRETTPSGSRRSVYLRNEVWDPVVARSAELGISASAVLGMILTGREPLPKVVESG